MRYTRDFRRCSTVVEVCHALCSTLPADMALSEERPAGELNEFGPM